MKRSILAGDYAEYFDYLMEIIGGEGYWHGQEPRFVRLFERAFYWQNPLDGNWQQHVEELRGNAIRIGGVNPIYIPNREASVLEVLIKMAIDIEMHLMYRKDDEVEELIPGYFSDIFTALGFDCEMDCLEYAIDRFLSGEVKISYPPVKRPTTLWEQINYFYKSRFEIENDGL